MSRKLRGENAVKTRAWGDGPDILPDYPEVLSPALILTFAHKVRGQTHCQRRVYDARKYCTIMR